MKILSILEVGTPTLDKRIGKAFAEWQSAMEAVTVPIEQSDGIQPVAGEHKEGTWIFDSSSTSAWYQGKDGLYKLNNVGYEENWTLLWADEFDNDYLDETKWARCTLGASDWNDTMSTDPSLISFNDGTISLIGKKNDQGDAPCYITAGITTKGRFEFTYGKVVVRAKIGSATGAWPAIWMTGNVGSWPANGEIDMLEHLNKDAFIHQNLHSVYAHSTGGDDPPHHIATNVDVSEWHTYGVEWLPDVIKYTIDGNVTLEYKKDDALGDDQWPFNHPFSIILSMQIGGGWVAETPVESEYPISMDIDYIRIYSRDLHK